MYGSSSPASPPPVAGQPTRRPTTVTGAVVCLLVAAVASLGMAVVAIAVLSAIGSQENKALRATGGDLVRGVATTAKGYAIATAVVYVAVTVALLILAMGNLRGRPAARIGSFVVSGVFVACGLCGVLGGAGAQFSATDNGVQYDFLPGWYRLAATPLAIIVIGAHVGVIVLLAQRRSAAFFGKVPAAQAPPVAGYGTANRAPDAPPPPYGPPPAPPPAPPGDPYRPGP